MLRASQSLVHKALTECDARVTGEGFQDVDKMSRASFTCMHMRKEWLLWFRSQLGVAHYQAFFRDCSIANAYAEISE